MTAVIRILLLAMAATGAATAAADDAPANRPAGEDTPSSPALIEFVRQNPACVNFTDSCVICRRDGDRLSCSTPAIACVTAAPVCTDPGSPAKGGTAKAP